MQCPNCKSRQIRVIDSRDSGEISRRRRYECYDCKTRFTTYEYPSEIAAQIDEKASKDDRRRSILKEIYQKAKEGLK